MNDSSQGKDQRARRHRRDTSTAVRWQARTGETEAMKDGSDAVADWPILNALSTLERPAWVSVHTEASGWAFPYSGTPVVADGNREGGKSSVPTGDLA